MAQPTPYTREFNFSNQQAATPASPIPAPHVDAELNRVKLTLDQTLANLALIQNDSGELIGGTLAPGSVGFDELAPDVVTNINTDGGTPEAFAAALENALPGSGLFDAKLTTAEIGAALLAYFNTLTASTTGVSMVPGLNGAGTGVVAVDLMGAAAAEDGAASVLGVNPDGDEFVSVKLNSKNVCNYGVTGDGTTDDTAALTACFVSGGDWYVPEGDYLIAAAGADAGGVDVAITNSLYVRCHPKARFFTDNLDNDFIRINPPTGGAGLPADKIDVEWIGGIFDQREQKVSTSVPFLADYPPPTGKDGASGTCDGISIRGEYEISGTYYHGFRRVLVSGVTCIAGDHWITAGGDSGIFIAGSESQTVEKCTFYGARDLGVYGSGDGGGQLRCKTVVRDNIFVNCCIGSSVKRSAGDTVIRDNDYINCVRAGGTEYIIGGGADRVTITGNTGRGCSVAFRVQRTAGFSVTNNHFTSLGALEDDGSTIVDVFQVTALLVEGSTDGIIFGNTFRGLTAGAITAFPANCTIFDIKAVDMVTPTHIVCLYNIGDALRTVGADAGTNNTFIGNVVYNALASSNMSILGTNAYEVRTDVTTGAQAYTSLGFANGSVSAPSIFRRDQPATGIYFGTSALSISANGTHRLTANSTGLLVNIPTYADDAAAATGGLTAGMTYKTATGEMRIKT